MSSLFKKDSHTVGSWFRNGDPWIWMTASAVSISTIAVLGLLVVLAVNGLSHFWPSNVYQFDYDKGDGQVEQVIGEFADSEAVSSEQLRSAGQLLIENGEAFRNRLLIKSGNREVTGADFKWYLEERISNKEAPKDLMVLERHEWGNFYGTLKSLTGGEQGEQSTGSVEQLWPLFEEYLTRAQDLHHEISALEKGDIRSLNYRLERLRLAERGLDLNEDLDQQTRARELADIEAGRAEIRAEYGELEKTLGDLRAQLERDSLTAETAGGRISTLKFSHLVRATRPNDLNVIQKVGVYFSKLGEFLTEDPREANTEGGVFPAIFGTVMMVLLMSIMVTPFGVVAAVYLREYAKQGFVTRAIRIAVNNLAGVPSIVYGVFGLGFFIYGVGEHIDNALFEAALPSPTFGTPGLLWASLTLALLTVPVVIVATEEGLSRIPRAVREGSLALGATKAETLWRVVIPMASPAIMTGVILAVARAAGEVAPLMLVGVVKLAPSLPVDGNFPFVHLDQKFMHLGFHIYDVGFQSPNVEAARPLVYATALLLVVVIAVLNFSAVTIRNRLRERYKALES